MKSNFASVLERELEHLEQRLTLLDGRYGASVEKQKEKLAREWQATRAALAAYRRTALPPRRRN